MTTTEQAPIAHPSGPFPAVSPIKCAPWCEDGQGHTNASSRTDQTCWGSTRYVELSLEDVDTEFGENYGNDAADQKVWPSIIGPCAYRGFNQHPAVYLHFTLQGHGQDQQVDDSCKLTAAEARQLAAHLIAVADETEAEVRR